MTWLSAELALRADFTPPPLPYTERPAGFKCGFCKEAYFTADARLEHHQEVHGVGWPHGIRARYKAGCRCRACKRSNADYIANARASA